MNFLKFIISAMQADCCMLRCNITESRVREKQLPGRGAIDTPVFRFE